MRVKVLVVEALEGRVLETRVVEGDLFEVVRNVAREAFEKWRPEESDFLVIRDDKEWQLDGEEDRELVELLEEQGLVREENGRKVAVVPYFLISYLNSPVGKYSAIDRGVYVVTVYLSDVYRMMVEEDAADLTAGRVPGVESN